MELSLALHGETSLKPQPSTIIDTNPAWKKIQSLDLEPVKFKLIKEKGWSLKKADTVEQLYKTYLLLFILHPSEEHVPTSDIDEMWHGHILDTAKYMADCHDIFGYYLHHYPYLGLLGADDAVKADLQFSATRQRFLDIMGTDPLEQVAASCGGGCGGHGCGGHSCGGHSCSGGHGGGDHGGGHHDNGGGHHHNDTPPPIISSCTSSDPLPSRPLRDEWKKKKEKPEPAKPKPANNNKKPFWKRILDLASRQEPAEQDRWAASVDPRRMRKKGRPARAELLVMAEGKVPEGATKH